MNKIKLTRPVCDHIEHTNSNGIILKCDNLEITLHNGSVASCLQFIKGLSK